MLGLIKIVLDGGELYERTMTVRAQSLEEPTSRSSLWQTPSHHYAKVMFIGVLHKHAVQLHAAAFHAI